MINAAGGKAIFKYMDMQNDGEVKAMVDACVADQHASVLLQLIYGQRDLPE
ncbi:hypothetical protein AAC978_13950 [Desulfitobacterium sp. THU1]|uniref:hypothetical protein n=1 Tax=Desulfitobacterium sp. THU1 TaxID=3138072 RepID=UPI00311D2D64